MHPRDFCYWLRGYLELGNPTELNSLQLDIIKSHLNLVMKQETHTVQFNNQYQTNVNLLENMPLSC